MVYGVDKQRRLSKNFFTNKITIKVPRNGIILTSSSFNDKYYPRASFFDERLGPLDKIFINSITRYEIPEANDTIMVSGKKYDIEVWFIKWEKNSKMINASGDEDSLKAVIRSMLDK